MSSDYSGYFMVVNDWQSSQSITISITHYKDDTEEGSLSGCVLIPGQSSQLVSITCNGDDHDYWTASVEVADSSGSITTWSRDKYKAGFEPSDEDHIVVLHVVDVGGDWGGKKNGPQVQMSFPVSSHDSFNLHTS